MDHLHVRLYSGYREIKMLIAFVLPLRNVFSKESLEGRLYLAKAVGKVLPGREYSMNKGIKMHKFRTWVCL